MISYKPLWITLVERDMTKTDLRTKIGLSTDTLARLGKNEAVSLRLIQKICDELNCTGDKVVEITPDKKS